MIHHNSCVVSYKKNWKCFNEQTRRSWWYPRRAHTASKLYGPETLGEPGRYGWMEILIFWLLLNINRSGMGLDTENNRQPRIMLQVFRLLKQRGFRWGFTDDASDLEQKVMWDIVEIRWKTLDEQQLTTCLEENYSSLDSYYKIIAYLRVLGTHPDVPAIASLTVSWISIS